MSEAFMVATIVPTAKGTRTRWLTPGLHYLTTPPEPKPVHTLWDCFVAYTVEHCIPSGGDPDRAWIAFRVWMDALGWDRDCSTLKREDGRTVVAHELARGVTPATARKHMTMGNAAIRHAVKEERIAKSPKFQMPRAASARIRWLRREEYRALMGAVKPAYRHLFWRIAFATGARTQAILDLTWDRVDLVNGTIDFRVPGHVYKNKRRGVVPSTDGLFVTLTQAFARRDPACPFVVNKDGEKVSKSVHYHECKKDLRAVGINERGVCRHVARHTVATWMLQGDEARGIRPATIHEVAEFLCDRVATVEVTYAHLMPHNLRAAARALH